MALAPASSGLRASVGQAAPRPLWLDDPARPGAQPPLLGVTTADLVVVGGGYAGLWAALRAVERAPGRQVVLLEATRCGDQASGRNGGFAAASLTHGFGNGQSRWPDELDVLDRMGRANLAEIGRTVARHRIDCDWRTSGELTVATTQHALTELREEWQQRAGRGGSVEWWDAERTRAEVHSPTYLGALSDPTGTAMVEPARLAWGLRQACLDEGVRIHEGSTVRHLDRAGPGVVVRTDHGLVRAGRVVLATNAFPPLLRRLRLQTVPVYDYVLATEPLSQEQRSSVGWRGGQGIGDHANLFHYYRMTRDHRIVFGGYDAVYHYGSRIHPVLEQRRQTFEILADHLAETFPQLEGLAVSHRWGGVIDTSTSFTAFYGTAWDRRVGYALGYTGLGVAATRFAADVVLDLLEGADTERTRLQMVRRRPVPFPPEPVRSLGINLTRHSLAAADRHGGRRNLWLQGLDRLGLGFDS